MNKVLEDIKNEKEYYDGLNEALYPDYAEIHRLMGDDGYSKEDYILYQQLINQNPADERLVQAIKNDEDGLFLLCFFLHPLERVIRYTFSNCLTTAAEQLIPPKYALFDAESICEELSKLKMLGRERIFNYYYDIDYRYSEKLRQAIMEPNVEIMRELLESNAIDLLWLQRTLGVLRYGIDLVDGVVNKTISEEDGDNLYGDFIKSLMNDEVPYIGDYHRITTSGEYEGINMTDVWGLYLKYYWCIHPSFREKTRTIIDAYINKPCFEEFVSKCRAEFDEDERLRNNVDSEQTEDSDNNSDVLSNNERQPQSFEVEDDYKPFIFSPTDKPTNLYPESEYAFDGSVGLASFAINNKERFERFIALTVNTFHYLHGKNQAKAFVRTITGIKCDGGVTKPKLQSDDAVYAVLYMAQRGILTGKINQALQKFDFEHGVKKDGKGNWHATYAKKTNNQFKRLVFETFCDYEGFKNDKNIDFSCLFKATSVIKQPNRP